jgi:hypothetical protein
MNEVGHGSESLKPRLIDDQDGNSLARAISTSLAVLRSVASSLRALAQLKPAPGIARGRLSWLMSPSGLHLHPPSEVS